MSPELSAGQAPPFQEVGAKGSSGAVKWSVGMNPQHETLRMPKGTSAVARARKQKRPETLVAIGFPAWSGPWRSI